MLVPTPSPILQLLCPGWVCPRAGLCPATGCRAWAPGWVQPRGEAARGQERAGGTIFQLLPTRGGVLWTAPFLVTVPLLCPFGVVMVPTESPVGSLSPEHTCAHNPFLKLCPHRRSPPPPPSLLTQCLGDSTKLPDAVSCNLESLVWSPRAAA